MAGQLTAMQEEVRGLRRQLFWQILERDRLLFVETWQLKHKYMRLFAARECAAYELNTKIICRDLGRELATMGTDPDEAEALVAARADERHAVWLDRLRYRNKILDNSRGWRLNRQWFERLDYYYALCVRLIHPDLYPAAGARHRLQMTNITRAYAEHNLPVLELKPEVLQIDGLPGYGLLAMDEGELAAERSRLLGKLAVNAELIGALLADHPFELKPLLDDEAACAAKSRELDELLEHLRAKLRDDE